MIRALLFTALALIVAGCAHNGGKPVARQVSAAPTYAEGWAEGRASVYADLAASPAFHVPAIALADFDNRNPWLPSDRPITPTISWRAYRHGNRQRRACAVRLHAAQNAIYQMLDAVREPVE